MNFLAGTYFDFIPTSFATLVSILFWVIIGLAASFYLKKKKLHNKTIRNALLYLLSASFFFRMGYLFLLRHYSPELIDGFYERAIALYHGQGLANTHGNPTALWMPGASLVYLSVMYLLRGPSNVVLFLTQTIFGFGMMLVLYLWGKTLSDEKTGLLAALIFGFFPSQIILETFGMSDLIFQVSLWGGILAFLSYIRDPEKKKIFLLLSGLLLGLTVITRPYGLMFVALYFACNAILLKTIRPMIGIIGIVVVFWLPWIVRNEMVFHHFIPFTTTSGINLWVAHHPGASGKLEYLAGPHPFLTSVVDPQEEYSLNQRLGKEGLDYILNHPVLFFRQIPKKWILLFASDTSYLGVVMANELKIQNPILKNGMAGFANGYYLTFLVLAFWFVVLQFKALIKNPAGNFGILLFFCFLAVFAVFHIETRFHIPLIPALCLYSACWIRSGLEKCFNSC